MSQPNNKYGRCILCKDIFIKGSQCGQLQCFHHTGIHEYGSWLCCKAKDYQSKGCKPSDHRVIMSVSHTSSMLRSQIRAGERKAPIKESFIDAKKQEDDDLNIRFYQFIK
jgi:hypothetical protein